jgi:hypothetical protein
MNKFLKSFISKANGKKPLRGHTLDSNQIVGYIHCKFLTLLCRVVSAKMRST